MPTFSVCLAGSVKVSRGHRKSFHTATTAKIETTPSIGRDIGRMIDHSVRDELAPSSAAANKMSSGIESKNRFSKKMLNALATDGSQITQGVFCRLRWTSGRSRMVRYCGM